MSVCIVHDAANVTGNVLCFVWRQTNEVVNTAVLTGALQSYPMTVYSVSHAGHVADVTSQATCHAGDADVLQVINLSTYC